jgi:hypothetical protein
MTLALDQAAMIEEIAEAMIGIAAKTLPPQPSLTRGYVRVSVGGDI